MPDPAASDARTPIVHGLLICRNAEFSAGGQMNLEEVLEVIPVEAVPGDAGPLTFVAFVRGLPPGKGIATFVIRQTDEAQSVVGRYPLDLEVPPEFADRQVALQARLDSVPVQHGGWYDVTFEWNEQPLARNRFAIGVRAK